MDLVLDFCNSFKPELSNIKKIMDICCADIPLSDSDISDMQGIPKPKIRPHINYAKCMGLIEENNRIFSLTKLGNVLKNEDPGFNEILTLFVMHIRLTSITGASFGYFMFKKILSDYGDELNENILWDEFCKNYPSKQNNKQDYIGKHIFTPFNRCYAELFNRLNLVNLDTGKKDFVKSVRYNGVNYDYIYVYAYALFHEWENTFAESQITADQLYSLKLGPTLSLANEDFNCMLQILQDMHYIEINAMLSPFTILKLKKSDELIDLLYSNLL